MLSREHCRLRGFPAVCEFWCVAAGVGRRAMLPKRQLNKRGYGGGLAPIVRVMKG